MKLLDRIELLEQYDYIGASKILRDFEASIKTQGEDDQIDSIRTELEDSENGINKLSNWNNAIENLRSCIEN